MADPELQQPAMATEADCIGSEAWQGAWRMQLYTQMTELELSSDPSAPYIPWERAKPDDAGKTPLIKLSNTSWDTLGYVFSGDLDLLSLQDARYAFDTIVDVSNQLIADGRMRKRPHAYYKAMQAREYGEITTELLQNGAVSAEAVARLHTRLVAALAKQTDEGKAFDVLTDRDGFDHRGHGTRNLLFAALLTRTNDPAYLPYPVDPRQAATEVRHPVYNTVRRIDFQVATDNPDKPWLPLSLGIRHRSGVRYSILSSSRYLNFAEILSKKYAYPPLSRADAVNREVDHGLITAASVLITEQGIAIPTSHVTEDLPYWQKRTDRAVQELVRRIWRPVVSNNVLDETQPDATKIAQL